MPSRCASSPECSPADVEGTAMLAQHDFRKKYLQKLARGNAWAPQAHGSPKHQTVVIFDWDDTLICSSWLRGREGLPHELNKASTHLRRIVQHAKSALETALRVGRTYIITNAGEGWVEYSASRWAPELLPVLQKVRIISARDKFEAAFPDDVWQWKIQAFLEVQRQLDTTPITNLVALGDADYEIEAARIMGGEFQEGLVKTVKFQQNPTPQALVKQLELVARNLEGIAVGARSIKLVLEQRRA